jgi:hypothetical protein
MVEAEWRQVLWGGVGTGANEDESSTGHICVAGFHHVVDRSRLAGVFGTYELFYLIFKFFSWLR